METAFAELPLALFTTLAPMGAGAFIALAVALCAAQPEEGQARRLDKLSLLPFLVSCVGFVAAAAHTANAMNGVYAFTGLGTSPLTNEIAVGVVFMVVALIYVIMGLAGKLGAKRKPFAIVTAVLGVVFALFVGMAYWVSTVPTWNTILVPLEILGFALVTGPAVYGLMEGGNPLSGASKALSVLTIIGAVLAVVTVAAHLAMTAGMQNPVASGATIVSTVLPYAVCGLVLVVIAAVLLVRGFAKGMTRGLAGGAAACAAVGVFLARLSFYAMYLSIGVTLM